MLLLFQVALFPLLLLQLLLARLLLLQFLLLLQALLLLEPQSGRLEIEASLLSPLPLLQPPVKKRGIGAAHGLRGSRLQPAAVAAD